jgi:hypothetical protein
LELPQAGHSPLTCLRFDLACVEFVDRWERERDATVEVPAPSGKRKPTVPKPKHSPDQLLRWLGIDPEEIAREDAPDPMVEAMADEILSGRADWLGLGDAD